MDFSNVKNECFQRMVDSHWNQIFYIGYLFVIPVLFTPWQWWQVILGIMLMHYITGFMLAIIFQPAHVIEGTVFPEPDQNNTLRENWTIHQLRTTTNFANGNPVITWLVGGLNYQVEHHLFPGVCHVHFPRIASIVRATALEYDLPYKKCKNLFSGVEGSFTNAQTPGPEQCQIGLIMRHAKLSDPQNRVRCLQDVKHVKMTGVLVTLSY